MHFHRHRAGKIGAFYALLAAVLVAALAVGGLIAFDRGSQATPAALKIFVSNHASQEQVLAIQSTVLSTPGLSDCIWWSNKRHYNELASFQYANSKSSRSYFQCHVSSNSDLTATLHVLRGRPGVLSVVKINL